MNDRTRKLMRNSRKRRHTIIIRCVDNAKKVPHIMLVGDSPLLAYMCCAKNAMPNLHSVHLTTKRLCLDEIDNFPIDNTLPEEETLDQWGERCGIKCTRIPNLNINMKPAENVQSFNDYLSKMNRAIWEAVMIDDQHPILNFIKRLFGHCDICGKNFRKTTAHICKQCQKELKLDFERQIEEDNKEYMSMVMQGIR